VCRVSCVCVCGRVREREGGREGERERQRAHAHVFVWMRAECVRFFRFVFKGKIKDFFLLLHESRVCSFLSSKTKGKEGRGK
jgi:hypothetical protein